MAFFSAPRIRSLLVGGLALGLGTAQAHTGHGTSGLWTGMVHPFGLDHLLAMVAVGLWSVSALPRQRAWCGPAAFLLALGVGGWRLGAVGLGLLPGLEHGIALSVVLFGAMLVLARQPVPLGAGLGLVASGGSAAWHGARC
jgi:urease accessory protein